MASQHLEIRRVLFPALGGDIEADPLAFVQRGSPARSRALMWTNMSGPPPSGSMKPKPFRESNHFTLPVGITFSYLLFFCPLPLRKAS
jgi:hypothetical protein